MDYMTDKEARQYGSDFNKWVALNTNTAKTVNNIDGNMYKVVGNEHYRYLIESKHTTERMPQTQKESLMNLQESCFANNNNPNSGFKTYVYIVDGNAPYDVPVKISKYPFGEDDYQIFSKRQLILFCNFEITWNKQETNWENFNGM